MTDFQEFTFLSSDGHTRLHGAQWAPADREPIAVLQIAHGVAEHILRYDGFARYLNEQGILVAGHDHLGHGKSLPEGAVPVYFGDGATWETVVDDIHLLHQRLREQYPRLPILLMGHSMGSFLSRTYLIRYPGTVDAAIIMGTGFQPKALVQFAKTLCRVLAAFHGWQYRSKFVANMSFMGYNKGLEGRTTHDWLNRDQAEVDKYLADERCTFTFTLNAYYSMFSGILRLHDPAFLAKMPKDLPLLFLAGDADPVGEQGKGVQRAIQSLKDAGVQNIECKLYPGARHELLVETNHQEVFEDIGSWLEKHLA